MNTGLLCYTEFTFYILPFQMYLIKKLMSVVIDILDSDFAFMDRIGSVLNRVYI